MHHHNDIHMTGAQARIGQGAHFVYLETRRDGSRRILFRYPGGHVETGFLLTREADPQVAIARIMRRRPGLRLDPGMIRPLHQEDGEGKP